MSEWREDVESEFGKDVYITGFSGETISTGSFVVDHLTGIGGIPLGHISEIFGTEGCGKTTLALSVIHEALRKKKAILYQDFETTVSDSYLTKLDINPKVLRDYRVTPETMEDGWMLIKRFCERKEHRGGIVVVDSLAAMPPEFDIKKMEEIIGQTKVGSMAQVMSIALKQMTNILKKSGVGVIFVNQERSIIDTGYQHGAYGSKTTPGGKAIKFYSAIRLKMVMRKSVTEKVRSVVDAETRNVVVALTVGVQLIKNKFAPSYREANILIRMDEGIDNYSSAIAVGKRLGFIAEKGGYYILDEDYSGDTLGKKKVHGNEQLREYFKSSPEVWTKFLADVKSSLKSSTGEKCDDSEREGGEAQEGIDS